MEDESDDFFTELPERIHVRARTSSTVDAMVEEEWSSLVDEHLSTSPRTAHAALKEKRRLLRMQKAWEKEHLREMEEKLRRYKLQEASPRLQRMAEARAQGLATVTVRGLAEKAEAVPFSQRQQQQILEEFQRQKEQQMQEQMEKEAQEQQRRRQQQKQQEKQQKQAQRQQKQQQQQRPERPVDPEEKKGPHGSQRAPGRVGRLFANFRMPRWLSRGKTRVVAVHTGEHVGVVDIKAQAELLVQQLEEELTDTQCQPLALRRRVFRDLQRKVHPDKNGNCEAAKLAFQHLMDRRQRYLQ